MKNAVCKANIVLCFKNNLTPKKYILSVTFSDKVYKRAICNYVGINS